MNRVLTGLDLVESGGLQGLKGLRLGLLANQASMSKGLKSAREVISSRFPGQLKALFGPQHGYGGEDQDNMVETPHCQDQTLKVPVFSLYAASRDPSSTMFNLIDVLIIDLQDVGTRVYTFISTMLNCLKAAAECGKKVVVLDRPNPLGGDLVEGNPLEPELYSFVGPWSLPMRHGLTMGEMARIFNHVFHLDCNLEVVPMQGWRRSMLWSGTGLRWTMPSPNMPVPQTAQVYPGQVIWEGTNLSEGRGTCRPFEIFGAPFLNPRAVREALDPTARTGCHLQEYRFRPTFHKWAGELCYGFMIHILDPCAYRPYYTSLALLQAVMEVHHQDFGWKQPPYEYEYKKKPIDMIMGSQSLRRDLQSGKPLPLIREGWLPELESYADWRKTYLLYS
ncbi:MAG: DUF1343 domain-containing protein [Deltaproteobacteria bacterium]|nr:DUF1343 domain-containing protein [Deltaproteobacteria bacterium]MBW2048919.1 DUF1343 domain-containing protein [Deltaproteobacteria bacterium]MBW2111269.1 DUF1343 domain-containing protein [Deltaproteobacteria bacterium]MBW2353477.1 DUF1343 domain-containing protein [Deltaproteobacteria bacterium]HDZ89910.1 DUF1343 domain-containing protein [Deltaproteobacteria bacterium]